MELKLENGRYVPDTQGQLERVSGREELLQRIRMKLIAHRGGFSAMPNFGSRLYLLGRTRPSERESVAAQYVAEALADEKGLRIQSLRLTDDGHGGAFLTLCFSLEGETLELETRIQGGTT